MKTAIELKAAIEAAMSCLDDDDMNACAWLNEILNRAEPVGTSRVVVTISGGVAEIADAESWPEGLEVYLVDYDQDNTPDSECCHVDGKCIIGKQVDGDGSTGHFANKVAEAWRAY